MKKTERRLSVSLTRWLNERIKRVAAVERRSEASAIRLLLIEALRSRESQDRACVTHVGQDDA